MTVPGVFRRSFSSLVIHAIDSGWTTRRPLATHVVVCGFPRAGSTLLSLMLQTAYPSTKGFLKERTALRTAYLTARSHRLLVSKRPDDIFFLEQIRRIYRFRQAKVRFLLTMRDPRSVLTSVHAARREHYYVSPERWRATLDRLAANTTADDCLVVKFESLVSDTSSVQAAVSRFLGETPSVDFDSFAEHVPVGFKKTALNGVRALDEGAREKWRDARHRQRIRFVLEQIPELPEVLIAHGYEVDRKWIEAYLS
jgi:hypothetical protein